MASFLSFLSEVVGAFLGTDGETGATLVLSGNSSSVTFPVAPPSFDVENSYNNNVVNVNSLGDINMIGKRGLKTLTFSSFFPAQYYGWETNYPSDDPYTACQKMDDMARSGQACTISISGTSVNMSCTIDNFKYGEHDSTGDVYFSISLKEYRYIMPATDTINDVTGLKSRVSEAVQESSFVAVAGNDTRDNAAKAIQRNMSIAKQATNRINLYRAMVKSGGIDVGTVIRTVKEGVKINDKDLILW